jgi:transcriptional regulator with XRE-family HTH domain
VKTNIIDYIIKNTDLKQKDLAEKLKVSPAQISKWKAGEPIPSERKESLNKLAGLHGDDADWGILTKTKKNGRGWFKYLSFMGDCDNRHLEEQPEIYAVKTLLLLSELGATIPENAPLVEVVDQDNYEWTSFDSMVWDLTEGYGILVDWCDCYLWDGVGLNDEPGDLLDLRWNLEEYALEIALKYVDKEDLKSAGIDLKKLDDLIRKTNVEVKRIIIKLCESMNKVGMPFTTDYFNYLNKRPDLLWNMIHMKGIFAGSANSVDNFLPFGERKILNETKMTNELLIELHMKIDTLLSDDNKKMLDKKLKYTFPDDVEELPQIKLDRD